MKYIIAIQLMILVLFVGVESSYAGKLSYTCTVMSVYTLGQKSKLIRSIWQDDFNGSQFSISRVDGQIIGEVLPTLKARKTYVHNAGSSANSFKASADFGDQWQLIEVQEFKEGEEKPFVAMSMGGAGIVTGACK